MDDDEACNPSLSLGLGLGIGGGGYEPNQVNNNNSATSLNLYLDPNGEKHQQVIGGDLNDHHYEGLSLKRALTIHSDVHNHHQEAYEKGNDDDDNSDKSNYCSSGSKKLKLTKEQTTILEQSFNLNTTLHQEKKDALAEQLNLRPRQVEVWFQNRRARIKVKKTEANYESLKKCCEKLTEENKLLKKEVQALRALKTDQASSSMYIQLSKPAATLTFCTSCERLLRTEEVNQDAVVSDDVIQNSNRNII